MYIYWLWLVIFHTLFSRIFLIILTFFTVILVIPLLKCIYFSDIVFADCVWKRTPGSRSLVCKSPHCFWNVTCMWVCAGVVGKTRGHNPRSQLNKVNSEWNRCKTLELLMCVLPNCGLVSRPSFCTVLYFVRDLLVNVNKISYHKNGRRASS